MNQYKYQDLTIEVINELTYNLGSSDNNFSYIKHYCSDEATEYTTCKHGIKIYQDSQVIDSCIIIGSGGGTKIHQNSSLLDKNQLLICCGNTIFCLAIPYLDLKWKTKADVATCFQIFKQQNDYLIHGELRATKLDCEGTIKWEFGGADIFVSVDGEDEFKIENDGILLTDFMKIKYKIDFDGKLIWDTYLK